jgi:hypothetical protein
VIGGQQGGGRTHHGENSRRDTQGGLAGPALPDDQEIKEEEGQLTHTREEVVSLAMKLFMINIGIDVF